jgi:hypothetical protein
MGRSYGINNGRDKTNFGNLNGYHLFTNTQRGARFADKTRQALAFEQLRTQRTHIIVYAGGHFELFETLRFVQMVLQLSPPVQERLIIP